MILTLKSNASNHWPRMGKYSPRSQMSPLTNLFPPALLTNDEKCLNLVTFASYVITAISAYLQYLTTLKASHDAGIAHLYALKKRPPANSLLQQSWTITTCCPSLIDQRHATPRSISNPPPPPKKGGAHKTWNQKIRKHPQAGARREYCDMTTRVTFTEWATWQCVVAKRTLWRDNAGNIYRASNKP